MGGVFPLKSGEVGLSGQRLLRRGRPRSWNSMAAIPTMEAARRLVFWSSTVAGEQIMPPFLSLRVFEAAARLGSFARAAEELEITAGAVSQHIRALEEFAGLPLFRRLGRGVELTDVGHATFRHATLAVGEVLQAGRAMRTQLRGRRISVSTAPSFASKWLIPRLGRFQETHPGADVRISADISITDFAASDVDLAVRYGPGRYEGLYAERLMSEAVIVVCSPRLAEAARDLEALSTLPLIHDDGPESDPTCPNWTMWFAARGIDRRDADRGLRFNQSGLAIEAAAAGKGLALAKRQLALGDLANGALISPLSGSEAPVGFAYWLVWPKGRRFEPLQTAFIEWLRAEVIAGDAPVDHSG